jgi:hypothetical protein
MCVNQKYCQCVSPKEYSRLAEAPGHRNCSVCQHKSYSQSNADEFVVIVTPHHDDARQASPSARKEPIHIVCEREIGSFEHFPEQPPDRDRRYPERMQLEVTGNNVDGYKVKRRTPGV